MKPDFSFVTYSKLPQLDPDDRLVVDRLTELGYTCSAAVWDDPSIDWSSAGTCVVRSTWDYHLNPAAFEQWIRDVSSKTRLFNQASLMLWNMRKDYIDKLASHSVATVPTIFVRAGEATDLASVMEANGWMEAIVKPVIGLATHGVKRFNRDADSISAAQIHVNKLLEAGDVMLQPYLAAVETYGERALVFIDGKLSHAVRKTAFQPLAVAGEAGETPVEATDAERTLGYKALECVGSPTLYARVDTVCDAEGQPVVLELELVEPSLFLAMNSDAIERFADALTKL